MYVTSLHRSYLLLKTAMGISFVYPEASHEAETRSESVIAKMQTSVICPMAPWPTTTHSECAECVHTVGIHQVWPSSSTYASSRSDSLVPWWSMTRTLRIRPFACSPMPIAPRPHSWSWMRISSTMTHTEWYNQCVRWS